MAGRFQASEAQIQGAHRIAIISDVHANLPALEAALAAIAREMVDAVFHTGDAIAIGPYPAETLDLLLSTPHLHCLMGNHDAWYALGIPETWQRSMDPDELAHQHWTHAQIASGIERVVAQWPYVVTIDLDGVRVALMHYALAGTEGEFAPLVRDTRVGDLDAQFETVDAEAVVFGHLHSSVDVQGRRRYIRPGSLGCHDRPLAPYAILAAHQGELGVTYRAVPYGDAALFEALERRQVPARAFIREVFLRREAPNWPWPY